MDAPVPADHPLLRLFCGVTEQAFVGTLGVADPQLVDYVSGLLVKFLHADRLAGAELASLALHADSGDAAERRERHRHLGDCALFWHGLYPGTNRTPAAAAVLGAHAYRVASTFTAAPFDREAPVLLRLSRQFDLCAEGLRVVRREFAGLGAVPGTCLIGR